MRHPLHLSLYALLLCATSAAAQTQAGALAQDLKRLTLEELAELDVTSVSRRVERLSDTAAAISVVQQDDIRRTGVTSLAEAMRLADAIDVARYDGRTWAVTARGFNISTANKLLVMMDGRTLYSPLFAGTLWDVQDTLLADIDRIEAIRGPGGTVWGANAINGVINILTKDATATRGTVGFLATGTEQRVIASARYGARLGASGGYRVYGKFRRRDGSVFQTGDDAQDDLQLGQAGFRMDSGGQRSTLWTLQGDAYRGTEGLIDRDDTDVAGGNLLGRWVMRYSDASDLQVQAYYDRTHRRVPFQFEETRDTFDVDVQRRMPLRERHDLVFGGNFRITTASDVGTAGFVFVPERQTDKLFSFFAQDEIALRPGVMYLTLGSKFERNDFTGVELQPTVRARWRASDRQTLWGAISRAVRLPTRFDTSLQIVSPTGAILLSGREDFDSESVVAYEAGYRMRPNHRLLLDLAAFVNRYDDLRSQEFPSRFGPYVQLGNTLNATTGGVEAASTFQASDAWRLHGSCAFLHKDFSNDPGSLDISGGRDEANDPSYFCSVQSYLDLPRGLALDGLFRAVGDRSQPDVPGYAELDLRLGYLFRPGWEISVVGQNLLHDRHTELGSRQLLRYQFERGLYVRSAWRF